jgi:hypothetical protein
MIIEKALPIPGRKHGSPKYPFLEMEVGDSIFFKGQNSESTAAFAARKWSQRHEQKFSCRNVDGGLRIWRTE